MPKLPVLDPDEIIKILKKKGFVLERIKGGHHLYYNPKNGNRVVVPFHKKDLPKGTLTEILRQAGIDKDEIIKLFLKS
ncbi:MAG: type II toxin-antitoxin system HicA family toxin [Candidatus Thermoplasmatota archaeon]|nr:type II toxin-antitoxin system HicA family toxin [Candidatus Thermoplasmatota archaeon]